MTEVIDDSKFVHLHLHTEYSSLDGINRIDTLPEYIKSIGQNAVAITDHGNVSGSYAFFKSCIKKGVQPIIGMEAYYTVNDRSAKEVDEMGESYYHLVLLALNNEGLHNLFRLSSLAYSEGMYRKPRIDDELLVKYSNGLLATSSCLGSRASQLILKGEKDKAERLIHHHRAIFNNRFMIELQLHKNKEQEMVNQALIEIADKNNLPMIVTNDCHYTHPEDKQLHEITLCMQTLSTLDDPKRFSFGDIDVHVGNMSFMKASCLESNLPLEAITNTYHIAKRINSDSYFSDRLNRYPKFLELQGIPSYEYLEKLSKQNLTNKFNGIPPKEYRDRLNKELVTIKKMGFSDYMLIVWDFISGARNIGVEVGPGRGSAGGSLVAYSLGITSLDPIKYNLLFERFLNVGRAATPKIFTEEDYRAIEALPNVE